MNNNASNTTFESALRAVITDPAYAVNRTEALHAVIDTEVERLIQEEALLDSQARVDLSVDNYPDPADRLEAIPIALTRAAEEVKAVVSAAERVAAAMRLTGAETFGALVEKVSASGLRLDEYVDLVLFGEERARDY